MKKMIILPAVVILTLVSTGAKSMDFYSMNKKGGVTKKEKRKERRELKRLESDAVSYRSKDQFSHDFENVSNVQWVRTDYFDEASFILDVYSKKAYYDEDGELVGTTEHKNYSDIPAKARKYIDSHYKDYSKADVILFDDNEANETGMVMYDQQFDDADNYFVDLSKGDKEFILQVNMEGDVFYFKRLH